MGLLTTIRGWFIKDDEPWANREAYWRWKQDQGLADAGEPSAAPRTAAKATRRLQRTQPTRRTRRSDRWVGLDFETATGKRSSACAIGIVVVEDGAVVDLRHWLIRPPGNEFSDRNIQVHGILPDDVESAPTLEQLWPEISALLADGPVVAHNAKFDMSVLRDSLAEYGIKPPALVFYCSAEIARAAWPELENHKLNTVCGHLGIELDHHNADSDAVAAAEIVLRSVPALPKPHPSKAGALLGVKPHKLWQSKRRRS